MAIKRLLRITTVPQSVHLLLRGQLNFMMSHGYDVLAVSAAGKEVQLIRESGISHTSVTLTRKITPLRDVLALISLIVIIIRYRPDIVHTHTPKAGLLGMMAAWICGVDVRIHTVAGLPLMEATGWKRKVLQLSESLTFRLSKQVYPNSKNLRKFMVEELRLDERKLKVLAKGSTNGIDTSYYQITPELTARAKAIRQEHGIPTEAIVLSFVGRIVRDKGIVELCDVLRLLGARSTATYWLLVMGAFEQDLDPLPVEVMKFLRESPNVVVAGFQHDTRPWLLASDIFVFPSYREGFPNVVMQAACLERPCIVSDINGCNEIVIDNVTGVLVPCKDVEGFVEGVLQYSESDEVRRTAGRNGRAAVVDGFDQNYVWNAILDEYQVLLKRTQ